MFDSGLSQSRIKHLKPQIALLWRDRAGFSPAFPLYRFLKNDKPKHFRLKKNKHQIFQLGEKQIITLQCKCQNIFFYYYRQCQQILIIFPVFALQS